MTKKDDLLEIKKIEGLADYLKKNWSGLSYCCGSLFDKKCFFGEMTVHLPDFDILVFRFDISKVFEDNTVTTLGEPEPPEKIFVYKPQQTALTIKPKSFKLPDETEKILRVLDHFEQVQVIDNVIKIEYYCNVHRWVWVNKNGVIHDKT